MSREERSEGRRLWARQNWVAADGLAEGERRPCWRWVASRAGLWARRGATLAVPKAPESEVEGRLRGMRAVVVGGSTPG